MSVRGVGRAVWNILTEEPCLIALNRSPSCTILKAIDACLVLCSLYRTVVVGVFADDIRAVCIADVGV